MCRQLSRRSPESVFGRARTISNARTALCLPFGLLEKRILYLNGLFNEVRHTGLAEISLASPSSTAMPSLSLSPPPRGLQSDLFAFPSAPPCIPPSIPGCVNKSLIVFSKILACPLPAHFSQSRGDLRSVFFNRSQGASARVVSRLGYESVNFGVELFVFGNHRANFFDANHAPDRKTGQCTLTGVLSACSNPCSPDAKRDP